MEGLQRCVPLVFALSLNLWILGCDDPQPDPNPTGCTDYEAETLVFEPEQTGVVPGAKRLVHVAVDPEPEGCDLTISLSADASVTVQETVTIADGTRTAPVEIEGTAAGSATVTATLGGDTALEATVIVEVAEPSFTCSAPASGEIGPGEELAVATDGLLLRIPEHVDHDAVAASIACSDTPIVPEGFVALGPAVNIGPVHERFDDEVLVHIPMWPALLPPRAGREHIQVFYTGPGVAAPRLVPFANRVVRGGPAQGMLELYTQRFGTFQAAVEPEAGSRTRTRRYTFRGIVGVSMGGGGASLVGFKNPDEFDFVAPLGGPSSWHHMLDYVGTYHMGGFCPVDPEDPSTLENRYCDVPPARQIFEREQDFEHWFYPDDWGGQGGTFDRKEYCQIFRDLSFSFGNPGSYDGEDQRYLPPGVGDAYLDLTDDERCASPVTITDYYDRDFNPDGSFPVITFCDGPEVRVDGEVDHGTWDPDADPYYPLDVALAVDLNENGQRDAGEPVIFNPHEPFEDVGVDGLASESEQGYDPVTNPDPEGDDWDYMFNPLGTEGNGLYETGEPYEDVGLDGVADTMQLGEGGYDHGEGNGQFDLNPNVERYHENDGYQLLLAMPDEQLDRIDVFADAGLRDLFSFLSITDGLISALTARGRDVHYYNNFAPFGDVERERDYDGTMVDYHSVGKHFMLRYGSPNPTEDELTSGDGGHVGTPQQILNRLLSVTFAMSARWPGGDRRRVVDSGEGELSYVSEFTDSYGRSDPFSVVLPPGYHNEEEQDRAYPVIYFLHGYGQRPEDLVVTGIIFPNYMISRLIPQHLWMQKLIMIFPDGRCRSDADPENDLHGTDGCIRGTFYADSWREDGPMMESALIELTQHIDDNFRTRAPEEIEERY